MLLLYSTISYSQGHYRLSAPVLPGRYYHVSSSDKKQFAADTAIRIVKIYIKDTLALSQKLIIYADSGRISWRVTDSSVAAPQLLKQLLSTDTSSIKPGYAVRLIESLDITAEAPVEDIYRNHAFNISQVLKKGFKGSFPDSNKSELFSLHGSVTVIGQLSDNKYRGQTIPQNYLRTYLKTDVNILGIPFSTDYNLTSENNQGVNKINNFRFSFQYDKFYYNMKSKMEKRLKTDRETKIGKLNKDYGFDITSVNKEYTKIKSKITRPDYKRNLKKLDNIIQQGDHDTSFRRSYRYKKATMEYKDHQAILDKLKKIEEFQNIYLKNKRVADINTGMQELNISKPRGFKRNAKKYGLLKPGQSIFLSMRKFDLGTFDPGYTTLVLSGVSLTGINIEMNPGNLYGAFSWGTTVSNFSNPAAFSAIAGSRNILSGRIGVGRTDKLLVAMSVLKGTDGSGNSVLDSNYSYYLPSNNYVLGVDMKYKITPDAEVGIEYAKAENQEIAGEKNTTTEQLGSLIKPSGGKYSSAWYAYAKVSFAENTTRLKASTRFVDPFYYSFGTPYLRRDNFRIELKGEQLFWKNQLTAGVTYRRDEDNLYHLKQGTSVNNTFIFNVQIKIKRYPYLILTYAPSYQSFYNSVSKSTINSNVKMYNAILGYTYQDKKTVANTTLSYTKQYSESNQPEWISFHVDQYAFYENVILKKRNLGLTAGVTYILPRNASDTGKIITTSLQATKGIFKNKMTLTVGYRYQKDFGREHRNIAEAGTSFQLGWGISFQLMAEKHFIRTYQPVPSFSGMWLGRITLIKTF